MNRNGTIIYLSFPFCHFPCQFPQLFMKLLSDLVPLLIASFLILKSCVDMRNYSTGGPFGVSCRKSSGLLRLSFHNGEMMLGIQKCFSNSMAIGTRELFSLLNNCWLPERYLRISTPTTTLFFRHTHHAHYHVLSLPPAVLVQPV